MLRLDILTTLLLIGFILFSVIGVIRWRKLSKNKKTTKKDKIQGLIIPISLIIIVVFSLGLKTTMDIQSINYITKKNIEEAKNDKWELIEKELKSDLEVSQLTADLIAEKVIKDLSVFSNSKIDYYLDNIGIIENNPIQKSVGDNIKGIYFQGIVSDANDPFGLIIGKNESDSFIFSDYSENCSVGELTRGISSEISMHSNKELAKLALDSLIGLKTGKPCGETIFWQFAPKKVDGAKLSTLDYKGLKKSFFDNDCDLEKTFGSVEFLTPCYIYRDKSLGGTPRIIDRTKTDAKVIGIVSVFSLYEAINNDSYTLYTIERRNEVIRNLESGLIQSERFLLLTSIFVMLISIIMFLLLWMYLHYNGGADNEGDIKSD